MIRLILLILTFAFIKESEASGFREVMISSKQVYVHPEKVSYAFTENEAIILKIENGKLIIRNPRNFVDTNVQVVKADGTMETIKVLSYSRLAKKIFKDNYNKKRGNANSNVNLIYSKTYDSNEFISPNKKRRDYLNSNRFSFINKINQDNEFRFNYWDATNKRDKGRTFSDYYNGLYRYKDFYFEHGYLPSNPRPIFNDGGNFIWANRAYYKSSKHFLSITEGNNRNLLDERDQIYGINYEFVNYSGLDFGTSYFTNKEKEIDNYSMSVDYNFDKLYIKSAFNFGQDNKENTSSLNYRYNLFYKTGYNLFRSIYFEHENVENGLYNPVFGNTSSLSYDKKSVQGVFGLIKKTDTSDMNLGLSYDLYDAGNLLTNSFRSNYSWTESRISFGFGYAYSQTESNFSNFKNDSTTYSPSLRFSISKPNDEKQRSVSVSNSLSETSNGITSNLLNLNYSESSVKDRFSINFGKRTSTQDFNNLRNSFYSLTTSYQYKLNDSIYYNLSGGATYSKNENEINPEYNSSDLSNYSYKGGISWTPNSSHSLNLNAGQSFFDRNGFSNKSNNYSLNYTYRFKGDWKTPLNYIVNNRSLKIHLYKDNNYNNVIDKDEEVLSGTTIKIIGNDGTSEFKKTNEFGFVHFSGLKKQNYSVEVLTEDLNFVSNDQRNVDLTDDSAYLEIGLGNTENIVIKVYDRTTELFIQGNLVFEIGCPSVNYTKTVQAIDSAVSLNIPAVKDCSVKFNPSYLNTYIKNIEFFDLLVEKRDIIFYIAQANQVDFNVYVDYNKDGKIGDDEALKNSDVYVQYKNQKFFQNEGQISFELGITSTSIDIRDIIKTKNNYNCKFGNSDFYIINNKENKYLRTQKDIICSLKK